MKRQKETLNKYMPTYNPQRLENSIENNYDGNFNAQQQLIDQPMPIDYNPAYNNQYQLTFKKDQHQKYFIDSQQPPSKRLFSQYQSSLFKILAKPLDYFSQMSMQQLSSLPYADLMSLDNLSPAQNLKLSWVGELLQVKRIRMKAVSCMTNLKCLRGKDGSSLNNQQKHKIYLLQLLWKQLNKKLFIEVLKLNLLENKYRSLNPEVQGEEEGQYIRRDMDTAGNDVSKNHGEESYYRQEADKQAGLDISSINQEELIVFNQLLSLILKKSMFYSFNKILKHSQQTKKQGQRFTSKKQTKQISNYKTSIHNKQMNNLILIPSDRSDSNRFHQQQAQHIYYRDRQNHQNRLQDSVQEYQYSMGPQEEQQSLNQQQQYSRLNNQNRDNLQQLQQYIQHLHQECSQTDNLKKKFFIKWKIYILQGIVYNIVSQMRQQYEQQGQGKYFYDEQQDQSLSVSQNQPLRPAKAQNTDQVKQQSKDEKHGQLQPWEQYSIEQQDQRQRQMSNSKYSSINQQQTLKTQKRRLKQYLRNNYELQFMDQLRNNLERNKIASITNYISQNNLKKRMFGQWHQFAYNERLVRDMQGYYQEMACDQNQDFYASDMFYKTNLLYKYYRLIKQNWKSHKLFSITYKIVLRTSFHTLRSHLLYFKKQDQLIRKKQANKQNHLLFKSFRIWKQQYINENAYPNHVKIYIRKKQTEIKRSCFMMIKINFKKELIKMIKTTNQYNYQLKYDIFEEWKIRYQNSKFMGYKEKILKDYLYLEHGEVFLQRMKEFYQNYREYQRFTIKVEKLKRQLTKVQALKGIRQWRKRHAKNKAYSMIQKKLIQMKGKQKKRQIFKTWVDKLTEIQNSGLLTSKSQNHKDWLVKYYGKLCSVYQT